MNGRILVLNQPAEMHTPAEYLFPTGMPLELFQEALRICKLYHGANCRPQSTDTIRNLKVYDKERREIICAPVGCQYVALSYVWGKQNASLNADRLSDFRDLPGTVADSCVVAQKLGSLHVDRPIRKCLGCSQFRKLTTPVYRPGQPQREDGADHADERHLRRSASGPHCRIGQRCRSRFETPAFVAAGTRTPPDICWRRQTLALSSPLGPR
jgi:hypothetical protein